MGGGFVIGESEYAVDVDAAVRIETQGAPGEYNQVGRALRDRFGLDAVLISGHGIR